MTYDEPVEERGAVWRDKSTEGDSRQGGSRWFSSDLVKKRGQSREEGEVKRGDVQIVNIPKKERHLKKSNQSKSANRPAKKFSENDLERTNLILNSEKKTKGDFPKLWASLSICWGSNAQVSIHGNLDRVTVSLFANKYYFTPDLTNRSGTEPQNKSDK